ncbi:GNAT family N-acetyltransferase [Algibacter agarivorans]|uniref:GNAT family N-acetyltransferase n=1 Tax=Algibacter agarivorans TaxID=1109741 RepID=A0ABP9G8T4_9FLAO
MYNIHLIKTSNYKIKLINPEDTHQVRHPVLRSGMPMESCIFDGDNFKTTIHLGLFDQVKLVGICSFFKNNRIDISETPQYQLRGMAILKEYQGKGIGNLILSHGETLLKTKNIQIVWCNAREVAVNFYKKSEYKIIGKPFDIKNIGLHYAMYKKL